jgi:hypothetical protein
MVGDFQTSVLYNALTGEVALDVPPQTGLASIEIVSSAGIFSADPAQNVSGDFDIDNDTTILKLNDFMTNTFGSLSFGKIAQPGLTEAFLLSDLSVDGSFPYGVGLGNVDLIYIPEPSSLTLAGVGLLVLLAYCRRRRHTG